MTYHAGPSLFSSIVDQRGMLNDLKHKFSISDGVGILYRYRKYMGAMTMYYTRIEKLRRDVFLAFKEVLVISHNIKKYCRRIVYV